MVACYSPSALDTLGWCSHALFLQNNVTLSNIVQYNGLPRQINMCEAFAILRLPTLSMTTEFRLPQEYSNTSLVTTTADKPVHEILYGIII